MSLKISKG